jgi:hypothetical protein
MYEKLSLEYKIRWAEGQIVSSQKSLTFWCKKESDYRSECSNPPSQNQCLHLRAIKQYRKKAKADMEYWTDELEKLKNKKDIYILFS